MVKDGPRQRGGEGERVREEKEGEHYPLRSETKDSGGLATLG